MFYQFHPTHIVVQCVLRSSGLGYSTNLILNYTVQTGDQQFLEKDYTAGICYIQFIIDKSILEPDIFVVRDRFETYLIDFIYILLSLTSVSHFVNLIWPFNCVF